MLKNFLIAAVLAVGSATAAIDDATKTLARAVFKELIEINTTDSVGDNTVAARALEKRFLAAGFPAADVRVLVPEGRSKKGNLVVRLRGSGQNKPILLLGHLDVVEARREDWTTNPFEFVEKDGYFYGRGTVDMKDYDAVMVTTFLRFRQTGIVPSRDLILALTSDEEGGTANGADWLLKNHRALLDAEFVLNGDSGGVTTEKGKAIEVGVGAAEKLYADFELTVTNPGGHSSRPPVENAIYRLSAALGRLSVSPFPVELNPVTRSFFGALASNPRTPGAVDMKALLKNPGDEVAVKRLSEDSRYNALLRTTCVATRLMAGHANNALPQTAQAIVNCRILPGHSPEEIRKLLVLKLADPKVAVRYVDGSTNKVLETAPDKAGLPPSEPTPEVRKALSSVADSLWSGAGVTLNMSTGASDSKYTLAAGMPSFGIGEISVERDDERAHGKDERVPVASFYQAVEFFDRFLRALVVPR